MQKVYLQYLCDRLDTQNKQANKIYTLQRKVQQRSFWERVMEKGRRELVEVQITYNKNADKGEELLQLVIQNILYKCGNLHHHFLGT